jgi:glycosyltransferase involved in cell wall biosynthesis
MINPCRLKGSSIFLRAARHFPNQTFVAVPTWGTCAADRRELENANVRLVTPSANLDVLFAFMGILLVPSLWVEAWGRVVIEAMLRGIPVVTTDSGGLPEAKLGTKHVLPSTLITEYRNRLDDRGFPVPVVPEQDMRLWYEALEQLLEDPQHYSRQSAESELVATRFVKEHRAEKFANWLSVNSPEPLIHKVRIEAV